MRFEPFLRAGSACAAIAVFAAAVAAQGTEPLSLAQALERARITRPQASAAAGAAERARGERRRAISIPNPGVQFERDDVAPTNKATITQPLAWVPRRGADYAAGRALLDRGVADSVARTADLARDVRYAFFTSLAADARERLVAEQATIADSVVRLADRRVAAGDISSLERDQVSQEASRTRLALSRAREDARIARSDFARAVAWTGSTPPRATGELGDGLTEPELAPSASAVTLVELVPALRAARADSALDAARLTAARIGQVPMPALMLGREWGRTLNAPDNVIAGFSLPLPIWSQGRELVAEARGRAIEGAARAAEARLSATAQVDAALIRTDETRLRARFARDSLVPEAARLRAGAVRLYESGRTGILPVFDAMRAEREVSQTMIQELLAFQFARADLLALEGRWR